MIKQGFMVRITSWENDGDCYNTKTFGGLSPMQVTSLVAFCRFLQENKNQYNLLEVNFSGFIYFHGYIGFSGWECDNTQEYFQDLAYEIVGTSEVGGLRVLESFDVHYIPSDLEDYSDKF